MQKRCRSPLGSVMDWAGLEKKRAKLATSASSLGAMMGGEGTRGRFRPPLTTAPAQESRTLYHPRHRSSGCSPAHLLSEIPLGILNGNKRCLHYLPWGCRNNKEKGFKTKRNLKHFSIDCEQFSVLLRLYFNLAQDVGIQIQSILFLFAIYFLVLLKCRPKRLRIYYNK